MYLPKCERKFAIISWISEGIKQATLADRFKRLAIGCSVVVAAPVIQIDARRAIFTLRHLSARVSVFLSRGMETAQLIMFSSVTPHDRNARVMDRVTRIYRKMFPIIFFVVILLIYSCFVKNLPIRRGKNARIFFGRIFTFDCFTALFRMRVKSSQKQA